MCLYFADMVGAKLTRHTTLGKYLDAVSFSEGNPSADPTQEFPLDVWTIEQKISETNEVVEFELSSALNFQGIQLPRRQRPRSLRREAVGLQKTVWRTWGTELWQFSSGWHAVVNLRVQFEYPA